MKYGPKRPPPFATTRLTYIFASLRSRENWMPERPKLMTTGQHFWPGHKWQIASAFVSSVSSASLICISFEELSLNSTSSVSKHKNELFFKALAAADADHKDVKEHLFFSRVAKHSSSEVGGEREKLVLRPGGRWNMRIVRTLSLEARHVFLFSFI